MRYAYNVCTFGYTMAWWNWTQWQEEIDRLALWCVKIALYTARVYGHLLNLTAKMSTFIQVDELAFSTEPSPGPPHIYYANDGFHVIS